MNILGPAPICRPLWIMSNQTHPCVSNFYSIILMCLI